MIEKIYKIFNQNKKKKKKFSTIKIQHVEKFFDDMILMGRIFGESFWLIIFWVNVKKEKKVHPPFY